MARLPQPGGDDGNWGTILNDFLGTVHKTDGSLKDNSVTSATIAPGAVNVAAIAPSGGVDDDVLVKDSTAASGLAWKTPSGGAAPAVTSVAGRTGAVVLAESDITNLTADLAAKADTTSVVTLAGAQTVAGVKTFSSSPVVPTPTGATDAANKSYVDGVAASGAPNADNSTPGLVQLAGDLGGTYNAPSVAKVNGITVSGTPSSGQVLTATGASAANWQTPSGGGGGGWTFSFRTATAATTAADHEYILADASSTGFDVTLPAASAGAIVRIKRTNSGANGVQIVPQGGALIDGAGVGSHVLSNQYDAIEFVSDGTNWYRN